MTTDPKKLNDAANAMISVGCAITLLLLAVPALLVIGVILWSMLTM